MNDALVIILALIVLCLLLCLAVVWQSRNDYRDRLSGERRLARQQGRQEASRLFQRLEAHAQATDVLTEYVMARNGKTE